MTRTKKVLACALVVLAAAAHLGCVEQGIGMTPGSGGQRISASGGPPVFVGGGPVYR